MGFDGTPSLGCKPCRTRKIKCDRTQPECSKCVSAGRKCPGVPNELDRMIRIIEKPNGPKRRKSRSQNVKLPSQSSALLQAKEVQTPSNDAEEVRHISENPQISDVAPLVLYTAPSADPAEHGSTFLMSVMQDVAYELPALGSGPFLRQLPAAFLNSSVNSTLRKAISCVGLGAIAEHHRTAALRKGAYASYGDVLLNLQQDLQRPETAITSEIVLTMMCLALYECSGNGVAPFSTPHYRKHMDGAINLLLLQRSRQPSQLLPASLAEDIRTQVVFSYCHRSKPVPQEWIQMDWSGAMSSNPVTISSLTALVMDLPLVRSQAKAIASSDMSIEAILDLQARALGIDRRLQSWYDSLDDTLHPRIMSRDELPKDQEANYLYDGVATSYHDVAAAYVFNFYRIFRIYCHTAVLSVQAALQSSHPAMYEHQLNAESWLMVQVMVDEICSSVPFYFAQLPPTAYVQKLPSPATCAFYVIQPLLIAASVKDIPEKQRDWLKGVIQAAMDTPKDKNSALLHVGATVKMTSFALQEESSGTQS